ncbi:MAG TPA: hypothetical protein VFI24_26115 [Pyrinomonadaceae bacterium]|nr:hypothetical protein [Pyrinomonadaceae bacterium]
MKGKERQEIEAIFEVAIQQLQENTESATIKDPLPKNLRDYLTRVQLLARSDRSDPKEVLRVD